MPGRVLVRLFTGNFLRNPIGKETPMAGEFLKILNQGALTGEKAVEDSADLRMRMACRAAYDSARLADSGVANLFSERLWPGEAMRESERVVHTFLGDFRAESDENANQAIAWFKKVNKARITIAGIYFVIFLFKVAQNVLGALYGR